MFYRKVGFTRHFVEIRIWPVAQVTGGDALARYKDHLALLATAYVRQKLSKHRGYNHVKTEGDDDQRGHWLGIKLCMRIRKDVKLPQTRIIWVRI